MFEAEIKTCSVSYVYFTRPKVLSGLSAVSTHFPLVFHMNKFLQDTSLTNVGFLAACLQEV